MNPRDQRPPRRLSNARFLPIGALKVPVGRASRARLSERSRRISGGASSCHPDALMRVRGVALPDRPRSLTHSPARAARPACPPSPSRRAARRPPRPRPPAGAPPAPPAAPPPPPPRAAADAPRSRRASSSSPPQHPGGGPGGRRLRRRPLRLEPGGGGAGEHRGDRGAPEGQTLQAEGGVLRLVPDEAVGRTPGSVGDRSRGVGRQARVRETVERVERRAGDDVLDEQGRVVRSRGARLRVGVIQARRTRAGALPAQLKRTAPREAREARDARRACMMPTPTPKPI